MLKRSVIDSSIKLTPIVLQTINKLIVVSTDTLLVMNLKACLSGRGLKCQTLLLLPLLRRYQVYVFAGRDSPPPDYASLLQDVTCKHIVLTVIPLMGFTWLGIFTAACPCSHLITSYCTATKLCTLHFLLQISLCQINLNF